MTPRSPIVVALSLAIVGFAAEPVHAHALRMTVSLADELLTVTTRYDGADHDGGAVTVTITNDAKEVFATGKIGPDGRWTTTAPIRVGKYHVVAEDDFGHRDEKEIEILAPKDSVPREWKGSEPLFGKSLGFIVGFGAIALGTLVAWWFLSKKKSR